jgi:hypothetical protein
MLVILVAAVLGFAANRRWWLVVVPIAFGAFFGSAVNTTSIFTMSAAGVAGFALGMLVRRLVERRRGAPTTSG